MFVKVHTLGRFVLLVAAGAKGPVFGSVRIRLRQGEVYASPLKNSYQRQQRHQLLYYTHDTNWLHVKAVKTIHPTG